MSSRNRRYASIHHPALAVCQALERRMLLSLAPVGAEFRVNSFTTNAQQIPVIASDADGDFVVVWEGSGSGDGNGVFAQRYNAAGVAQGSEFRVNTSTTNPQRDATVAMDADGDFVVAWESLVATGNYDIFAQRYNAAGVPQGGEFRANTFTTSVQENAAVAIDASGNFVITWMSFGQQSANTRGIYAQRYNAAGVAQGGEMHVNTITTTNHRDPSAAMDADGDLVIVWASDASGITAQRYNSGGATVGGEFNVNNSTTTNGSRPTVAMDAAGDFVVVWNGNHVFVRLFNSAGVAQGLPFAAATFTTGFPVFSSVAMDADGDFLVTWERDGPDGSSYGVFAQSFNAAGVPQGSEFRVNTFTTNRQRIPAVAMDADGDAVVAWNSLAQDNPTSYGVYAQRYSESNPDTAPPMVGGAFLNGELVTPGQRFGESVSSLVLSFSEDMSVAGGTSGANSATNRANYRLTLNGTDISSQITSANFQFNAGTRKYQTTLSLPSGGLGEGSYVLTVLDNLRDLAGNTLDGNLDGSPGGNFTRAFSVVPLLPVGTEFRVNATTSLDQRIPAVAREANGDFVVVWQSEAQDGSFDGIYGRRYNAAGTSLGGEFRVNAITTNNQRQPAVAMDADGDFVVAWGDSFGAGDTNGVFARRYNANGLAQGIEFKVNTFTTNSQSSPTVAMDAAGNFVVAWQSFAQEGINDFGDIYAQRYNAAGVAQGGEFRVNTTTTFEQTQATVAMDSDGDFVIAWQSGEAGLNNYDIFAQRYNAAGVAQGAEFPVNSTTAGNQIIPSVAMSASGDFVVAWQSGGIHAFAQRYRAAGVPHGIEFRVDFAAVESRGPSIAIDADGDFIVAFTKSDDVYARRFNFFTGTQGKSFLINTFTTGDQHLATVAMDADGDFVVAWESQDQDGSGYGIYAQRFARLTEVNVSNFLFQTAPHRLQFTFNDNVSASLGTDDILLENLTSSQTIPSGDLALSYDTLTNTATFSYTGAGGGFAGVLPDGNYRATLLAAGITNAGGTPLAANHVFNFFFLNGDANHDGRVNLSDFNILAANFGQSPRDFSQGDFTYDTVVNLADFNILASRFGQVLPAGAFGRTAIGENHDSDERRETLEELT